MAKKEEWETHKKILLKWKVGSERIKMKLFHHQYQQDFSCLHWNDAGHCWSFIGESPKIAKILAEEKFQNKSWTLIMYIECIHSNWNCISVSICKKLWNTLILILQIPTLKKSNKFIKGNFWPTPWAWYCQLFFSGFWLPRKGVL